MERKKRIRLIRGFAVLAVLAVIAAAAVHLTRAKEEPGRTEEADMASDSLYEAASAGQLRHVDGYEAMEFDNEQGRFAPFLLSEQYVDGREYYKLSYEEKDVTILINAEQSGAEVFHAGKSERFPITRFYSNLGSEGGSFHIADLTGDGTEELLYIGYGGGTGVHEETYCILNLETMKRYEIEEFTGKLIGKISARAVGTDENGFPVAEITDTRGDVRYGKMWGRASEDPIEYTFDPQQDCSCYYLEADKEGHGLKVAAGFTLEPSYGAWMGEVTGYMKYDSRSETFLLTGDYEVELYEPVDWNESKEET